MYNLEQLEKYTFFKAKDRKQKVKEILQILQKTVDKSKSA